MFYSLHMKAIESNAIVTSITAKQDKSLGLRMVTPELTNDEKVAFLELQGVNVKVLINPLDTIPVGMMKIDTELNQKSQGQRIRAVCFLLWRQEGEQGSFEQYYKEKTDKYIEFLKEKIV